MKDELMTDELIKQEESKAFALEDEMLEGVAGGGKMLSSSEDALSSECAPNRMPGDL